MIDHDKCYNVDERDEHFFEYFKIKEHKLEGDFLLCEPKILLMGA